VDDELPCCVVPPELVGANGDENVDGPNGPLEKSVANADDEPPRPPVPEVKNESPGADPEVRDVVSPKRDEVNADDVLFEDESPTEEDEPPPNDERLPPRPPLDEPMPP